MLNFLGLLIGPRRVGGIRLLRNVSASTRGVPVRHGKKECADNDECADEQDGCGHVIRISPSWVVLFCHCIVPMGPEVWCSPEHGTTCWVPGADE